MTARKQLLECENDTVLVSVVVFDLHLRIELKKVIVEVSRFPHMLSFEYGP